ncbi:MAG: peptidylprolyl isomerase [bacterium]
MRRTLIIIVIGIALISLYGCRDYDVKKPITAVGDRITTIEEFVNYYINATKYGRPSSIPEMKTIDDVKTFLKTLLYKDALVLEAEARGLFEDEEYKTQYENKKISMALEDLSKTITAGVKVSDEEVMDLYKHLDRSVIAQGIYLDTKKMANEALQRIKNGENFEDVAKEYDPFWKELNKPREREFAYILDEGIQELFNLKVGETTGVIQIPNNFGYVILKVVKIIPLEVEPFDDIKENLKESIKEIKSGKMLTSYNERLLEEYPFEIFEKNLRIAVDGTDQDIIEAAKNKLPIAKIGDETATFNELFPDGIPSDLFKKVRNESREEAYESLVDIIKREAGTRFFRKRAIELKGWEKPEYQKELQDFKEEWAIDKLYAMDFKPTVPVPTDEQIREYYEKNKNWYDDPAEVTVRMIKTKDLNTANEVYKLMTTGEDIEKLVKKYSIDKRSKNYGGMAVFLEDEEDYSEVFQKAFERNPEEIIEPFEAKDGSGYFVVMLLNKREHRQRSIDEKEIYESVKFDLQENIETSPEVDARCREWMEKILNKYEHKIFEENLKEALKAVKKACEERGPVEEIKPITERKREVLLGGF